MDWIKKLMIEQQAHVNKVIEEAKQQGDELNKILNKAKQSLNKEAEMNKGRITKIAEARKYTEEGLKQQPTDIIDPYKQECCSAHEANKGIAEDNVKGILNYIGENPNRDGLLDTPKRYIKFLDEFLSPPEVNYTVFESDMDQMVIVKDIDFYSLCEHHIAPFFGVAHVAYIPNGKVVGISKLARTVEYFSRRLQNQERITTQVVEKIAKELGCKDVAVVMTATHLCMSMRGVRKLNAKTTTSKMIGAFKTDVNARNEFLNLIK